MGKIRIFNVNLPTAYNQEIVDGDDALFAIDIKENGTKKEAFAISGSGKQIKVYDVQTLKPVVKYESVLEGHNNRVFCVKFNPD